MTDFRNWLVWARIPLALLGIGCFFTLYNRFILDINLRNLKTSLSVLDKATGVGQAEAALILVDQALVAEMAKEELNLKNLAVLQYAQGTLATDQRQRPVEDAQVMVASMTQDKSADRPALLTAIDGVVSGIQYVFGQATLLPRQIGPVSDKIDSAQLSQAMRWERLGSLKEAAQAYQKLLEDYPTYSGRATLKLKLGYIHQRMQEFDQAARFYRETSAEAQTIKELQTARQLLDNLAQIQRKDWEARSLEERLFTLGAGSERQRVAFELGSSYIQLEALDKAARTFHQAILADPKGDLALPSLFKEAWCLRTVGRFDDALQRFQEIIRQNPKGQWAAASYHQIAEAYKAAGDYDAAIRSYEKILSETEDQAFIAIVHAQTGATYRYDLKNPEKAAFYLQTLPNKFPASSFSSMEQQIQHAEATKSLPNRSGPITPATPLTTAPVMPRKPQPSPAGPEGPVLQAGSPLMGWIESFLPLFVDVFCERLARYMQVVGETAITRRFTEQEFRELVVRRVRERFPGQVTDVTANIRSNGFIGAGTVRLGILTFTVRARVGIQLVEDRPHTRIEEIRVGAIEIPETLRTMLETRVNQVIDRAQYPLKIKKYELSDGYALISVELITEKKEGPTPRDQVLF